MTDTPNRPAVRTERRGHVLLVTLDRPEARNAVNGEMSTLLGRALHEADTDPEIRVVVLTGAGKAFCAGADIKARAGKVFEPGERWEHNRLARELGYSIMECKKPVIAAVNGAARATSSCALTTPCSACPRWTWA